MIQVGTIVKVCDKTGVVLARCIKVLGPTSRRIAVTGNTLVVAVKHVNVNRIRRLKVTKRKRYYRGTLHRAPVTRTKAPFRRSAGVHIKFDENSVVIVNKRVVPLSNRVFGPILRELCVQVPSLGRMTRYMLQKLMFFDHKAFYKYTSRSLVINKMGFFVSTFSVSRIITLMYLFRMTKLEDLDDIQIHNYLYFHKFFFGRRGFLSEQKSFFSTGTWTYTTSVNMFVTKDNEMYRNLFIFFNEYLYFIDQNHVMFGFYKRMLNIYYIIIRDLNFFSERKTNTGPFNLETSMLLRIYFKRYLHSADNILFTNLKSNMHAVWL